MLDANREVLRDVKTRPSSFNPKRHVDPKTIATIKVVRSLSGGLGGDAQVLLCELVGSRPNVDERRHMDFPPSSPGKNPLFVAKVFDPMFFCPQIIPPIDNFQLADQRFSRESSALQYLYNMHIRYRDIMGHPHMVPEYYGNWAVEIGLDDGETRYVGAVLMEYINGPSIEKLCFRDTEGRLHPRDCPIYAPDTPAHGLTVDEDVRKEVLKKFLEGFAGHFHIGVEHYGALASNLFVLLDRGAARKVVRVVILDYSTCRVFEKTTQARTEEWWYSRYPIQLLPHPPHPFETFNVEALEELHGWISAEWEEEYAKFDDWLRDERNIGPVVDGAKWFVFTSIRFMAIKREQERAEVAEKKRKREEAAKSWPAKASRRGEKENEDFEATAYQ
ncbi:hypothetical protein CPLU01_12244 [Colletotrichum plurivorum]|uniref:Uncharacterized protein n=1 Tax=Colletotrichum plurivorum TaxID=2175906 RepID=A0A8H6N6K3_9PEZI|nr:hypothetical protein CPLU01_12244 [Colletotrichum plurivorum]